jgi:hypothetical protein
MKKKILLFACFFQLLIYNFSFSQIDTANLCNWNWEDQRKENWRMSDGSNAFRGGDQICPPFVTGPDGTNYCNDAHGLMTEVRETGDYRKAQGWYFVGASFGENIDWPYFILYNKYRAILRIFYFIGNSIQNLSYATASLRFSSLSPAPPLAILSSTVPYKFATDKYFGRSKDIVNDLIVQSITDGAIQNQWNAVDFAIMFDPHYGDKQYKGAKMYIRVDAVDSSDIKLHGRSASSTDINAIKDGSFVFSSKGNEKTKDLSILNDPEKGILDKGAETLASAAEYSKSISEELDSIKPDDPKFLQSFKKDMQAADVPEFFSKLSKISKISSEAATFISAASLIIGLFSDPDEPTSQATSPVINYQVLEFTGSITAEKPMIGFDVKVPGVLPSGLNEKKSAFDCPLGLINLSKTPKIKVTKPYQVYCSTTGGRYPWRHYLGGYFLQYNLDENIEIAINDIRDKNGIQEMDLLDLKFAIVCEAQKNDTGKYYYDINNPYTNECFSCSIGHTTEVITNRVYNDLMNGRFVIHKYNPDKQVPDRAEVYFGTPYVDPEYFRGITFEVPEKTDVYLGVSALFKAKGYEQPVVFHAMYKFDTTVVPAIAKVVGCVDKEQTVFPYSNYYNFEKPLIILDKPSTAGIYTTGTILMESGFSSTYGFVATAAPPYKKLGEEKIERIPYPPCKTCQ